ncbi:MAG TPA: hypothetical protein VLE49_21520 [Anaerolineales bacterium]|nr:hypothetical protein [Anaerolineales bacterium]
MKREIIVDSLFVIPGIIIGISLVSVLFGAFFTFDQLVRLEYHSYPSDWEKDGRPRGFFWFPSGWRGSNASLIWLFSTPEWVRNDEKAKKLIRRLRILVLIWNGSFVLGFVSIMIVGTLR